MANQRTDRDTLEALLHTVVRLRHVGEARRFFRDLLTDDELEMISRRWQVAAMLAEGRSYRAIEQSTGMSSRTVARIARWYKEGPGGYRLALARNSKRRRLRHDNEVEPRTHEDTKPSAR